MLEEDDDASCEILQLNFPKLINLLGDEALCLIFGVLNYSGLTKDTRWAIFWLFLLRSGVHFCSSSASQSSFSQHQFAPPSLQRWK